MDTTAERTKAEKTWERNGRGHCRNHQTRTQLSKTKGANNTSRRKYQTDTCGRGRGRNIDEGTDHWWWLEHDAQRGRKEHDSSDGGGGGGGGCHLVTFHCRGSALPHHAGLFRDEQPRRQSVSPQGGAKRSSHVGLGKKLSS